MYPNFYSRELADKIFLPRCQLIAEAAADAGIAASRGNDALFLIDTQIGFCQPGAGLYVNGAEKDIANISEFIYRNTGNLAKIFLSMDTHHVHQIFFPSFWRDESGRSPAPYTIIAYDDLLAKRWFPRRDEAWAEAYVRRLEEQGKYQLCIWPYHTMLGSVDHALQPLLYEACLYHSLVRGEPLRFVLKGEQPLTENYSVFAPEVELLQTGGKDRSVGVFNRGLAEQLGSYDRIFIAGEASSHCVKATIEDFLSYAAENNPELTSRLCILADCMSPVSPVPGADFPLIAAKALEDFAAAGAKVVRSSDY